MTGRERAATAVDIALLGVFVGFIAFLVCQERRRARMLEELAHFGAWEGEMQ